MQNICMHQNFYWNFLFWQLHFIGFFFFFFFSLQVRNIILKNIIPANQNNIQLITKNTKQNKYKKTLQPNPLHIPLLHLLDYFQRTYQSLQSINSITQKKNNKFQHNTQYFKNLVQTSFDYKIIVGQMNCSQQWQQQLLIQQSLNNNIFFGLISNFFHLQTYLTRRLVIINAVQKNINNYTFFLVGCQTCFLRKHIQYNTIIQCIQYNGNNSRLVQKISITTFIFFGSKFLVQKNINNNFFFLVPNFFSSKTHRYNETKPPKNNKTLIQ
eukprot:TRINITY_DN6327_c0_g1_i8.p1 TRINITY_DN6327_c0_g1~~TRINITY_DN6327_c0_g1_i8.p1  ORF type:complete len:269 (+),score=-17.56 TRINITY_DN6327_c0_g1_i8:849-1655(+)